MSSRFGSKAGGLRVFGFTIFALITGFLFTMVLLWLLISLSSGAGVDWSSLFNYSNSIFGMGGWYVIVFVITLILSGAIYTFLIARRADIKRR